MAAQLQKIVAEHVTKRDYGDVGDDAASDALAAIADRDVANWNVGEVYEDLYGGGDTAGALDRLIRGRSPHFGDASVLQTLLSRLKSLHRDVEKEMHA